MTVEKITDLSKDLLDSLDRFLDDRTTEDDVSKDKGLSLDLKSPLKITQPDITVENDPPESEGDKSEGDKSEGNKSEGNKSEELKLVISKSNMIVEWSVRPGQVTIATWEQLGSKLLEMGVVHGILKQEEIEETLGLLPDQDAVFNIVVAKGTPVTKESKIGYELMIPNNLTNVDKFLSTLSQATKILESCLENKPTPTLKNIPSGLILVTPGTELIRSLQEKSGKSGKCVFGEIVLPKGIHTDGISCGSGVEFDPETHTYVATQWGYLANDESGLRVVSPIVITEDKLSVLIVDTCPPNTKLASGDVLKEVKKLKIMCGVSPKGLEKALERKTTKPRIIRVLKGKEPVPSVGPRVDLQVALGRIPGRIREDGSIDFRDINHTPVVADGDLVAIFHPAVPGVCGRSVFGVEIPSGESKSTELPPIANDTIRVEQESNGQIMYYSQSEGTLSFENGNISISPELKIVGDVNYATGNLDFNGNISISGSVLSDFSVKCKGNLLLGGIVENGAQVSVGGSITVRGILGKDTRVFAGEDITVQFVQDAYVECNNCVVGSFLLNAKVQAGNDITIMGRGKNSCVLGGQIVAKRKVICQSLGNALGASPKVAVGLDLDINKEIDEISSDITFCNKNRDKLMEYINASSESEIRSIARSLPGNEKAGKVANKLLQIIELHQNLETKLNALCDERQILEANGSVEISKDMYEGTEIFIGRGHTRVNMAYFGVKAINKRDKITFISLEEGKQLPG
ncbi:MAG: hypothetical protein ACI8V2_000802 [Candidatus Latescibacterota bacterium]|jgi:uncharacterized protein (DUF342 family)